MDKIHNKNTKKIRVLHLEDDNEVIKLVRLMLKNYDYIAVNNIRDAIDLLRIKKFDYLILDLKLRNDTNELEGLKAIRIIKEKHIKTKIIILTAFNDEAIKAKQENPKIIKAIINKPFLKKQLIKELTNH